MSKKTEALGELYEEITGEQAVMKSQDDDTSREAISEQDADIEQDVQDCTQNDGLDGAVEGSDTEQAA